MTSEKFVELPIEQQRLIHGQVGNISATVNRLRQALASADLGEFQDYVTAIQLEITFLKEYLPPQPAQDIE